MVYSEPYCVLLLILLFFILWVESKKYALKETFGVNDALPTMSYVMYITFLFGLFGPLIWIGFL